MSSRAPTDPGACPSQLQLDRLSGDEVTALERRRLEHHITGCPACERGVAQRAAERAEFVADPRLLARLSERASAVPPARHRHRIAIAVPAILCAAAVLLVLRTRSSSPAIERRTVTKGGFEARLVIERDGELLPIAGAGGLVHPGDRLQVAISVQAPRFVAVYSIDGAGTVSRYVPIDRVMLAMAGGAEQVLPNSTILDEVPGRETIAVFACLDAQSDTALRDHVQGGTLAGCEISRIELRKVVP